MRVDVEGPENRTRRAAATCGNVSDEGAVLGGCEIKSHKRAFFQQNFGSQPPLGPRASVLGRQMPLRGRSPQGHVSLVELLDGECRIGEGFAIGEHLDGLRQRVGRFNAVPVRFDGFVLERDA